MSFSTLPSELLVLIAQEICTVELRCSAKYLTISKAWYRATLPVYLSNLHLSDLYLSAYDLQRWPPLATPLSDLLRADTRRLSIRLVGHPSKRIALKPWRARAEEEGKDEEQEECYQEQDTDWIRHGPARDETNRQRRHDWALEIEAHLSSWRTSMNEQLGLLSGFLFGAEYLQQLSFEASSEEEGRTGPRSDYFFASSMSALATNLPNGLATLTLDTCGSDFVADVNNCVAQHICKLIAGRLDEIQHIRLRMRYICPCVFSTIPSESSKLKSLVIKLSLPFFPEASYENHNKFKRLDAHLCGTVETNAVQIMISAGVDFACSRALLSTFCISFRDPQYSGINLAVADCVRQIFLYEPSEIFCYEDDGKEWMEWEDDDTCLRDSGHAWMDMLERLGR